jgi:hypothetical protein
MGTSIALRKYFAEESAYMTSNLLEWELVYEKAAGNNIT